MPTKNINTTRKCVSYTSSWDGKNVTMKNITLLRIALILAGTSGILYLSKDALVNFFFRDEFLRTGTMPFGFNFFTYGPAILFSLSILFGMGVLLAYLTGETSNVAKPTFAQPHGGSAREELAQIGEIRDQLNVILHKINISSQQRISTAALDAERQDQLLDGLKAALASQLTASLREEFQQVYGREARSIAILQAVEGHYKSLRERLTKARQTQIRNAVLNLFVGFIFAVAGLFYLGNYTSAIEVTPDQIAKAATEFSVRLSLVVLLEILAFFFLSLYRTGLTESKYFENELTNMEARMMAFLGACRSETKTALNDVLKDLARTERNFLLKRGESTVSLRQQELADQQTKTLLDRLAKAFSREGR